METYYDLALALVSADPGRFILKLLHFKMAESETFVSKFLEHISKLELPTNIDSLVLDWELMYQETFGTTD
jgi:hypothetical protein